MGVSEREGPASASTEELDLVPHLVLCLCVLVKLDGLWGTRGEVRHTHTHMVKYSHGHEF